VPLVAAAVCPHPPLLIPQVAGGAAEELDEVRAGCDAAVQNLLATGPDVLAVVGAGPVTAALPTPYRGDLTAYGLDLRVGDGAAGQANRGGDLPLSLLVAAWLLARHPHDAYPLMWAVAADAAGDDCARLGREVLEAAEAAGRPRRHAPAGVRVALLAMGDGSACRASHAPGYADPRAEPFDAVVGTALRLADLPALACLDAALARELLVAGRPAWQVLAGAAQGQHWRTTSHLVAAPYGVGYFATSWWAAGEEGGDPPAPGGGDAGRRSGGDDAWRRSGDRTRG
jgi:hypothetical protein